ncbi:Myosin-8 [Diplonema papillatum]|nr:Myosin-8 [Diplonema papillatum]
MPPKAAAGSTNTLIEPGALAYFNDKNEHSWVLGTVKTWDGKLGSCQSDDPKAPGVSCSKLKEDDIFPIAKEVLGEDVDDLLNLTILHDATLLNCLKLRYFNDVIYTNIGAIIVALNPFNFKIPRYMDDQMPAYLNEGDRIEKNLPHSWAVAHNTYYEMINDSQNQCVLVSGESGAGKTEASKIVMKYLGALSSKRGEGEQKDAAQVVGKKINMGSPILEAFGNARTVRNDNSSRFGKFMKIQFSPDGFLVGAFIIKYLLEKSRIITAAKGERIYHSFYLSCRAPPDVRAKYKIKEDKDYKSASSGKQFANKEFNTEDDYNEVVDAMKYVGMTDDEVDGVWRAVAGILHLENTNFLENGEGSTLDPKTKTAADNTVEMWQISQEVLLREFNTTTLNIAGSKVVKELRPVHAYDARDSLVKTLYDEVFGWLVVAINKTLDQGDSVFQWIGLLDIFGFEDFETGNYFEQLCINLANETIQGHYNQFIFQKDMDECKAEGIDVANIEFPDNTPCLHMIAGKGGILALLDEECSLGKGSDLGFLDNVTRTFKPNKEFFERKQLAKDSFIIHHYAGSVSYDVTNALDKNRDTLKDAYKLMMRGSENEFIKDLIPAPVEKTGKRVSVGGFFKNQLKELMDLINTTNPHWIRCVKPHPAKKPLHLSGVSTMAQLGSSGVLGTVKIRKAGYPVRLLFDVFWPRYRVVALAKNQGVGVSLADSLNGCKAIVFNTLGWKEDLVQLGTSRVFLKAHAYIEIEKAKKAALALSTIKLQKVARWKLVLPVVRLKRWEASCRLIQEEFREFMVRCAEIRKERERIRKELAAKHDTERKAMIQEGLAGFEPMYTEFELPLAKWKLDMINGAKTIEKMLEHFGESRQNVRNEHMDGVHKIEQQAELEFGTLQLTIREMLLECIELQEGDARKFVKKEEAEARRGLGDILQQGFAMVDVLLYMETEVGARKAIENFENGCRQEVQKRWDMIELEKYEWEKMMAVLLPKTLGVRKAIAKYQKRLNKRAEIVRERQMLEGGGGVPPRHYVQCMPDGRPVIVAIDDRLANVEKPSWFGPAGLPSIDQAPRASTRNKEEIEKLKASTNAASPKSLPLTGSVAGSPKRNSAPGSLSPSNSLRSTIGSASPSPRRLASTSYGPEGNISSSPRMSSWEEPPKLLRVDPASNIDHMMTGASADALAKMGESNPMFRTIFTGSRDECAAQLRWLHEQGAHKSGKYTDPGAIRNVKTLKAAETILRKTKTEHCEKLRKELKRLNMICRNCRVPDKHPVTQQTCKMKPVHSSLLVDYPPSQDVFLLDSEIKRLSTAILAHKDEVLTVLRSARKQGLLPSDAQIDGKRSYHELKTLLDNSTGIRKYDANIRCPDCSSFYRETVGRCWSCGGCAEKEYF